MKRRMATIMTAFGMATVLSAAPFGLGDGGPALGVKQALAVPGNGNGNANGQGQGVGHGAEQSAAGGSSNGQGLGLGHASGVAGVGTPPGQAKQAGVIGISSGLKGAFNAVHASPTAMANAASTSQVGKVKAYVDAVSADEIDIEAAAVAAAAAAKNHTVTVGMLESVNAIAGVEIDESTAVETTAEEAATTEVTDEEGTTTEASDEETTTAEATDEEAQKTTLEAIAELAAAIQAGTVDLDSEGGETEATDTAGGDEAAEGETGDGTDENESS